jgi:hypothetical protein
LATESSELKQDSSDTGKPSKGFLWKETYADYGMAVGDCTHSSGIFGFVVLGDKLIELESGDHESVALRNKFLASPATAALLTFS